MTLSVVCQAPANQPVVNINGRQYTPSSGVVTIPMPDAVQAVQQLRPIQWQGATSDRPTFNPNGGINGGLVTTSMFDTTLGEMICVSNPGQAPVVWTNASGSAV